MTESSSDIISHALQTVQEGLKSMQSLQFQTAETHKLFLQTQTEASKTLQKMMDHTRRIAEASLGISVIAPDVWEKRAKTVNRRQRAWNWKQKPGIRSRKSGARDQKADRQTGRQRKANDGGESFFSAIRQSSNSRS